MSTTPQTLSDARQVPLIERLKAVPRAARYQINIPNPLGMDTENFSVGELCHEAAALLAQRDQGGEAVAETVDVADRYAHQLAMWLELILFDYGGKYYNGALDALGKYRAEMNAIHEQESPTHMGEPVIPAPKEAPAQSERERFEAWAVTQNMRPHHKDVNGEYVDPWPALAWEAWQAALSAPTGEAK